MSLVEYVTYLKLEINNLRRALSHAIAREKLYEHLLKDVNVEEYPAPVMPEKAPSIWNWLKFNS
jgi:ABC-type transport system substrate-binding protein